MGFSAYIARSTEDGRKQTLEAHAEAVARLASGFGRAFCAAEMLRVAGTLHDFGKMQPAFQRYISGSGAKRGEVRHSVYGAKKALEDIAFPPVAELLANCIAAHHTSLYDNLSPDGDAPLHDMLMSAESLECPANIPQPDQAAIKAEFDAILAALPEKEKAFGLSMLTRIVYSCLVDADRWDAYLFESRNPDEHSFTGWNTYLDKLERGLEALANGPETEMSQLRSRVSLACAKAGRNAQGIYKLETPTGSGKTFSSLRFALEHARSHNLDRIIYVIPYLSITSQAAKDIRDILDADVETVLEHHSNFHAEESEDAKAWRLHTDRWDAPIILTTQVQFLESIFSAKASDLRKLHNMARSVIIFDEAQSLPLKCVYMFNGAINFLHRVCRSTILLCTATQPLLDAVAYPVYFSPEASVVECGDAPKRYTIVDKMKSGGYSYTELADFIMDKHSGTC